MERWKREIIQLDVLRTSVELRSGCLEHFECDRPVAYVRVSQFGQALSSWDTSKVTSLAYTFSRSKFNSPINNWNVGAVTDMRRLFAGFVVLPFRLSARDLVRPQEHICIKN